MPIRLCPRHLAAPALAALALAAFAAPATAADADAVCPTVASVTPVFDIASPPAAAFDCDDATRFRTRSNKKAATAELSADTVIAGLVLRLGANESKTVVVRTRTGAADGTWHDWTSSTVRTGTGNDTVLTVELTPRRVRRIEIQVDKRGVRIFTVKVVSGVIEPASLDDFAPWDGTTTLTARTRVLLQTNRVVTNAGRSQKAFVDFLGWYSTKHGGDQCLRTSFGVPALRPVHDPKGSAPSTLPFVEEMQLYVTEMTKSGNDWLLYMWSQKSGEKVQSGVKWSPTPYPTRQWRIRHVGDGYVHLRMVSRSNNHDQRAYVADDDGCLLKADYDGRSSDVYKFRLYVQQP